MWMLRIAILYVLRTELCHETHMPFLEMQNLEARSSRPRGDIPFIVVCTLCEMKDRTPYYFGVLSFIPHSSFLIPNFYPMCYHNHNT